jgi:hypothetical protein
MQIQPNHLMHFLYEHLRAKKKYYVIYEFVMNDFKDPNNTMQKIMNT